MKEARLRKLLKSATESQERAFNNFQETGDSRYKAQSNMYEERCDILNLALNAVSEHNQLIYIRSNLAQLANAIRQRGAESETEREILAIESLIKI